jgi:hypothetical protein
LMGARLQGANLGGARLQGANLRRAQLHGADLRSAQLQGANLGRAQLHGANLGGAQLHGADLGGAHVGSTDFNDANLTWSDLRDLSQSPLDENTYGVLKKLFTDTISNESVRTTILDRIQKAVGRSTNLNAASSKTGLVLCDNSKLFRFCATQAQSAGYADARAKFLVDLGCEGQNAAIARGIMRQYSIRLEAPEDLIAFAKHVTARSEKECPGWAALSADQKDFLRKLAAEKTTVR